MNFKSFYAEVQATQQAINSLASTSVVIDGATGMPNAQSYEAIRVAISGLSKEQAMLVMSTKNLNQAQQESLLVAAGIVASSDSISASTLQQALASTSLSEATQRQILTDTGLFDAEKNLVLSSASCTEAKLQEVFATNNVSAADQQAILAALGLTTANNAQAVSFSVLAQSALAAAKSMGLMMLSNPMTWIAGIAAATAGIVALIKYIATAGERANEKMEESVQAFEEAKSKTDELNTELKTTNDRINELESKSSLTLVEQDELDKLRESVRLMQIEADLAAEEEASAAKKTAEDTVKAYQKNFGGYTANEESVQEAYDILMLGQNYSAGRIPNYIAAIKQAQEARDALEEGSEGYAIQYQNYSDIIEDSTDQIREQGQTLIEYKKNLDAVPEDLRTEEQQAALEEITAQIEYIYKELDPSKWKQMTIDKLFDTKAIKKTKKEFVDLAKTMGKGIKPEDLGTEEFNELKDALDDAGIELDDFCTYINTEAGLVGDASNATGEYADQLEEATNSQLAFNDVLKEAEKELSDYSDAITSALDSSRSSVGMTIEEIEALDAAFGGLSDYDATKLFEETANGVHMNNEEFQRLNKEYTQSLVAGQQEIIDDLQWQIYNQRSKGLDTSALEKELTTARLLKSEYEGMTSAYNDYLRAKNGGSERDIYESMGSDYEEMQQVLEQGWYGDEQLNEYLDFMINAEKRTGNAVNDFALLTKTIEGTNHSLMDYWTLDDQGNLVTDGLYDFLDDVNTLLGDSYAKINEETGKYEFDFNGDKLEDVAEAFGTTTDNIESYERALISAGFAVNLADLTPIEQIEKFQESLTELQKSGVISKGLDLSVDVDTADLSTVQDYIKQLENERLHIDAETNPEAAATLDHLIELTKQTYYLRLDAETDGSLEQAASIIERIKAIQSQGTIGISVETEIQNQQQLYALAEQIANLPEETQTAIGVTTTGSVQDIYSQIKNNPETLTLPVGFTADTSEATNAIKEVNDEEVKDKEFDITVNDKASHVIHNISNDLKNIPDNKVVTVTTRKVTETTTSSGTPQQQTKSGKYVAAGSVYTGTARTFSKGTASYDYYRWTHPSYAHGFNWGLPDDQVALVNELGTESIVRNGIWRPLRGPAHIEQLKKGDIIFNKEQTRELIKYGRVTTGGGHGFVAQHNGTAYNTLNLNAYEEGNGNANSGNTGKRPNYGQSSSVAGNSNSSSSSNSSSKSSSSAEKEAEEFKETLDWIEIMIDRVERAISTLDTKVNSTYRTWSDRNRNLKSELSEVTKEISIQQQGYNRYLQQANAVGLSEDWAQKVRDGLINIEDITDEKLADQISEYRDWYEKALDCRDAIEELNESVSELYETSFNNVVGQFDSLFSEIEYERSMLEESINQSETQGFITSTKYYDALLMNELEHIGQLTNERVNLVNAFQQALNSGTIKEGSEAWAEMRDQINDVTLALKESNTTVMEYYKNIRDVGWEVFDLVQDRISQVTSEADFLIDLMDNKELYQDNGQLTDLGMSTMGLHGLNYNTYMAQADKYAEEMQRINRDIANDPYDQELLDRRQELLEAQRDNILAAEQEKDAIRDMVEEGIDLELDALKELIDSYTDALDAQKDLYDYQKKLAEMTDNIASLEKQQAAYANDDSEEARVKRQQIEAQLEEERSNLEETQYDRYVSDQKELLDDLYNEYEAILNARLDNLDLLVSDMIAEINSSAGTISSTLSSTAQSVGYTLSQSMSSIWDSNSTRITDVLTTYGQNIEQGILNASTTLNEVLRGIDVDVRDMMSQLDIVASTNAQTDVNSGAQTFLKSPREQIGDLYRELLGRNAGNEELDYWMKMINSGQSMNDVRNGIMGSAEYIVRSLYHELLGRDPDATGSKKWSSQLLGGASVDDVRRGIMGSAEYGKLHGSTGTAPRQPVSTVSQGQARSEQDNYGVALAAINGNYGWGTGQKLRSNLTSKGFNADRVQEIMAQLIKEGYVRNGTWVGRYYGIRSLEPYNINKFAKGIDKINKEQWAWTQEQGPEIILNPNGTVMGDNKGWFTHLAKGSSVLNNEASKNLVKMANDPSGFIAEHQITGIGNGEASDNKSQNNYTQNLDNVVINFPNVKNYEEMIASFRNDRTFERLIQSMTIDTAIGKSALRKYHV